MRMKMKRVDGSLQLVNDQAHHQGNEDSSAQVTVIQDGPISVSPGGSVRLTCSLSTGSVGGGNYPNWIYQILGSVPKLVIGSSGTSNQKL
ncbi:unnamed protein product [Ranitomeya imitator]|uniref:Uncharacterized protein n=1 Tax=Ranitomeya imitator TaxID=111125 RepID=A0ABN9MN38_9NEOB|nr:unnamed protein product [Ranitomeya imitator]